MRWLFRQSRHVIRWELIYDDAQLAELSCPPLTTVHQPIKEMAEKAIESLDRLCNGKKIASKVLLPVTLVVRETA